MYGLPLLAEVSGEIGFGIGGNGGAAERFRGAGAVLVLDGARLLRNDFIMRICWAAADMFGPGRLLKSVTVPMWIKTYR